MPEEHEIEVPRDQQDWLRQVSPLTAEEVDEWRRLMEEIHDKEREAADAVRSDTGRN